MPELRTILLHDIDHKGVASDPPWGPDATLQWGSAHHPASPRVARAS
jgi:hypothetical protein